MEEPRPQFCPWCASPLGYEEHEHEPRYAGLAAKARALDSDPPPLPESGFASSSRGTHSWSRVRAAARSATSWATVPSIEGLTEGRIATR